MTYAATGIPGRSIDYSSQNAVVLPEESSFRWFDENAEPFPGQTASAEQCDQTRLTHIVTIDSGSL